MKFAAVAALVATSQACSSKCDSMVGGPAYDGCCRQNPFMDLQGVKAVAIPLQNLGAIKDICIEGAKGAITAAAEEACR